MSSISIRLSAFGAARHFEIHNGSLVHEQQIHRGNDEGNQAAFLSLLLFLKDFENLRKLCFIFVR